MKLFHHFTSRSHLPGIAKYGLTIGDVPTDLRKWRGRIGVWLTTAEQADEHGLEGSAVNKKEYRFTVSLDDNSPLLHYWPQWAAQNVTPETLDALHRSAPGNETWWVYFGVIRPEAIVSCHHMPGEQQVEDWAEACPAELALKPVPPWRREAWQKRLLNDARRAATRQQIGGA